MEETHARLIEELAEVCRDYCMVSQSEALNLVGVPADSKWRQLGNVYYHPEIREILVTLPSSSTTTLESSEQPLTTHAALPLPKTLKGPNQASDQGQGADGVKDKGRGKVTKPPSKAKDADKAKEAKAKTKDANPKAKDTLAKAKEAEAKTKEVDLKARDASISQSSQKEDLSPPLKAKAQHLRFSNRFFFFFFFFVVTFCQCI